MVLKRYLACRTFSKRQPYSNESCLSIRTYIYKIDAELRLSSAVYQDDGVIIYTCKITAEKNA